MKHTPHGRGALSNVTGRFNLQKIEMDLEVEEDESEFESQDPDVPTARPERHSEKKIKTQFFRDHSRTIVSENKSPDIPFRYSMNFYRGCEHGCAYCYARPTHEYLGLSAGVDFESKIFVKENAPQLLRDHLMSSKWQPECINISGVTDCYQPAERKFRLTRQCLEVLLEFKNPVTLITKNHLITRDLDILRELAKDQLVVAMLSVTTLDADLARALEPRTSSPERRLQAIEALAQAGVPVGVNIAPVIPGLTDHEIPKILSASKEAGAIYAGYVPLRLPHSVSEIFVEWLEAHRPEAKNKVLNYLRELRGGQLNDPNFNSRMRGQGQKADSMEQLFHLFCKKLELNEKSYRLRTDKFQRPTVPIEQDLSTGKGEKKKPKTAEAKQLSFF